MSQPSEQPHSPVVLVDAHVHLHAQFSIDPFLKSAVSNFQRASTDTNTTDEWTGCLMFADMGGQDSLAAIGDALSADNGARFRGEWFEDGLALDIRMDERIRLLCVAGRQLTSAEGIEVLALATRERFDEQGQPLSRMLDEINQCGGLAVVPWGAGKWRFRRGALVAELVDRVAGGRTRAEFFLGDNRLRPRYVPAPRLFRRASAAGIGILPGSDALPLRRHARAAGSYGFVMRGALPDRSPANWLKQQLRIQPSSWRYFGRPSNVAAFVCDQAGAQWRRLRGRNVH